MIVRYPSMVLMKPCKQVGQEEFQTKEFQDLVETMFAAVKDYSGVGLAANQIGVDKQVFVVDIKEKDNLYVNCFVNPEIVLSPTETVVVPEMCLSLPGVQVNKTRTSTLTLRWQDREGHVHEDGFSGMRAVVAQHEMDHLHGQTIISSLPALKQKMLVETMRKNNKKGIRHLRKEMYTSVVSARESAKEMGIEMPPENVQQERLDAETGKRTIDE